MKQHAKRSSRGIATLALAFGALLLFTTVGGVIYIAGQSAPVLKALVAPSGERPATAPADNANSTTAAFRGDDRFGLILTDSTYYQQTLSLMGLRWYFDYSFEVPEVQAGVTKVLKLRADESSGVDELQAAARSRPGSYWLMGNEPNAPTQDDLSPQAYAKVFHDYVTALKAADPRAKIVAPEILNFDFTCVGCPGYPSGRDWLEGFRLSYRESYGGEPPVDVWSIHTYDLNWLRLPQGDYRVQAQELLAYRAYLDAIPEQRGKPIWLTEFSVVWAYDGIRWQFSGNQPVAHPVGELRKDRLKAYLKDMVAWLQANASALNIQRWFLFSSHGYKEPWASAPGGIALVEGTGPSARLTELGVLYRELAHPEDQPP